MRRGGGERMGRGEREGRGEGEGRGEERERRGGEKGDKWRRRVRGWE